MNILHVVASMDAEKGGVSQAIRSMIHGLAGNRVHNEVACLDDPAATVSTNDNFPVHPLGPAQNPWAYSKLLLPWLLKNLERFDAVIIHGLWLYNGYAVNKAMRLVKKNNAGLKKVIPNCYVMPHGMLDPYFQRAGSRKLKALRNVIYWKLIESKVINQSTGLLFTCEEEKILARQTFQPYNPTAELVVGLGIEEPPPFNPAMRLSFLDKCIGLNEGSYILFLSRIHEKKGVDLLINAYKELANNPNIPNLVIAGPNLDSEYGKKMLDLVKVDPVLQKIVYFPGMLSGDAKWGAIYGCEAFILPSHQENFGIAVVEALACSKPVLISNQVNIWSEINKDGAGIIEDDTERGTVAMLEKWTSTTEPERQDFNSRARQSFEANFSIAGAAKKLYAALKN